MRTFLSFLQEIFECEPLGAFVLGGLFILVLWVILIINTITGAF